MRIVYAQAILGRNVKVIALDVSTREVVDA